jgi:transcriptional regulator with XRE-family HTH domain
MSQGTAHAQVREALVQRGLPTQEVARRARVSLRTVQRLVAGRTISTATLEAVAGALGVSLDMSAVVTHQVLGQVRQELAKRPTVERVVVHEVAIARPVTSWREAARVLGLAPRTLRRRRHRAGCTRRVPWWPDHAACMAWYMHMMDGIEVTDAG